MPIATEKKLYKYLTQDGTGDATTPTEVDISQANGSPGSPVQYYVLPPNTEQWYIHSLIIAYKDVAGFSTDEFAGRNAPLSNGLMLGVASGDGSDSVLSLMNDLTQAVKVNSDWAPLVGISNVEILPAGGSEFLVARWDFTLDDASEDGLPGIVLDGRKGQRLTLVVQDNLSNIQGPFVVAVRGHKL